MEAVVDSGCTLSASARKHHNLDSGAEVGECIAEGLVAGCHLAPQAPFAYILRSAVCPLSLLVASHKDRHVGKVAMHGLHSGGKPVMVWLSSADEERVDISSHRLKKEWGNGPE